MLFSFSLSSSSFAPATKPTMLAWNDSADMLDFLLELLLECLILFCIFLNKTFLKLEFWFLLLLGWFWEVEGAVFIFRLEMCGLID